MGSEATGRPDIRLASWPIGGFEFAVLSNRLSKQAAVARTTASRLLILGAGGYPDGMRDYIVDTALVAGLVADGYRVYGPDGELLGAPEATEGDGATTDTTQEGATT